MEIEEVQRRAKSGPIALLARRAFAVVIGLLTTVTIPHLVSPRAYGLSAMSAVLFGLADMFKDFGLTSALLRKGEILEDEINFLFWFNVATTLILSLVIAAIAPLAGVFFHEPVVTWVILVSLIGFAAGGMSLQHRGLLNRDLRFAEVAAIDASTMVVQFLATLGLALLMHDVWAIVLGSVVSAVYSGVVSVWVSRWRPGRPQMIGEARAILKFGANTSVYSLSVFVSTNITAVLIGRLLGSAPLGQFNRANAFVNLPLKNAVAPMAQATLPVMARLRPAPDLYRKAYLELVQSLNLIVLPMMVVLLFAAEPLVAAVLGPRWDLAGRLLQALAPAVGALGFGYGISDLFVTQNRTAELRTLGLVEMLLRTAAVGVGVSLGAVPAALGYSAATVSVVAVRIVVAGRKGPVTIADHLRALRPSLPITLGAALGCFIGMELAAGLGAGAAAQAIAVCGLGGATALAIGLTAPSSRAALLEVAALLKLPGARRFLPART